MVNYIKIFFLFIYSLTHLYLNWVLGSYEHVFFFRHTEKFLNNSTLSLLCLVVSSHKHSWIVSSFYLLFSSMRLFVHNIFSQVTAFFCKCWWIYQKARMQDTKAWNLHNLWTHFQTEYHFNENTSLNFMDIYLLHCNVLWNMVAIIVSCSEKNVLKF